MTWLPDKVLSHLRAVVDLPDLSETPYRCIKRIGQGGMGTVYLAEDTRLHRNLALKILNQFGGENDLAQRMLQEAYIIAALEHPGIVPIHDVGRLPDGRIFYTMKFVKGARLDVQVKQPSSLPEVLRVFQKACEAVAFAHAHKVVHRDLKPDNIMVGDFGEVLVMDWGLSKVLSAEHQLHSSTTPTNIMRQNLPKRMLPIPAISQNLTQHGTVMGTPPYMAPEQQRGDITAIDERTDIYALGAILSFLLARSTSTPSSSQTFAAKEKGLPALVKRTSYKLPRQLTAIIQKATAEDKNDRYDNVPQLTADIENYLNGFPVSAYKENLLETVWRRLKQNKFLVFLILVYVLVRLFIFFLRQL